MQIYKYLQYRNINKNKNWVQLVFLFLFKNLFDRKIYLMNSFHDYDILLFYRYYLIRIMLV